MLRRCALRAPASLSARIAGQGPKVMESRGDADLRSLIKPRLWLTCPLRDPTWDLLFFHDPRDPIGVYHHVGLYVGDGQNIHAPTTGRTVEVKPIDLTVARPWGDDIVAGRPGASV